MPFGSDGVRAGTTLDTTPAGVSERGASAASTPTQRTHVCSPLWGTDSVEGVPLFPSVQPSGQQILSAPTRNMKATSVKPQTNRTTRSVYRRNVHRVVDRVVTVREIGARITNGFLGAGSKRTEEHRHVREQVSLRTV